MGRMRVGKMISTSFATAWRGALFDVCGEADCAGDSSGGTAVRFARRECAADREHGSRGDVEYCANRGADRLVGVTKYDHDLFAGGAEGSTRGGGL